MKDKKKKKLIIGSSMILLGLVLGISYALLRQNIFGNSGKVIYKAGDLDVILDESSTVTDISLSNASPMQDTEGSSITEVYKFDVVNNGTQNLAYEIYLDNDADALTACGSNCTLLEDKDVRYALTKDGTTTNNNIENRLLTENSIAGGKTDSYELRLYLNYDANNSAMGKYFFGKIRVEVTQDIKNDDGPKLASNMIPVKYNGTSWVKADTSDTWYNYDNQEWANAVTVSEASRANYLSVAANTPILMDDINTMWVWIPRYSYTIGSEDGTNYYGKQGEYLTSAPTKALPGEIDIKFIETSEKETGTAQYKVSEGVSGWRTPDAFTFGDKELSGVWVAKFETSNQEGIYESDDSSLTPIVKPKVTSWRNARVSTMETVAMNMTKENNIYGLTSSEVDSHMMKNSEWALAAYLSQSRYGKLGNRSYTGANKEIYINNYSAYKTGCSAGTPSASNSTTCPFEYDNLTDRGSGTGSGGGGASTTGNIYGIYDMSGGSFESVMGNYNNYSGRSTSDNSGYSGMLGSDNSTFEGLPFPENKYYNLYTTDDINTACNGKVCPSHALSEVAGWYNDSSDMTKMVQPWLTRGGYYGGSSKGGMFNLSRFSSAGGIISFRLVLTQ